MTLSHMLQPFRIGDMTLKNRVAAPPHAAGLADLLGSEADAERYITYWESLAEGGTAMVTAHNGQMQNNVPPGFDPTGVGAVSDGIFRHPLYVERMGMLTPRVQAFGTRVIMQCVMQGGMPHAPSQTLSGPTINDVPHALTRREIAWFTNEYRFSARQALAAGCDGFELHANHDDLIEWFLSPLTNFRSDEYGGSFENRMRFLAEILSEIREEVGRKLVIGVRLNMFESEPGGYDTEHAMQIAEWIEQTGMVDYLHLVVGTGWGFPSYIQSPHFASGQWAEMAGQFRKRLNLPIIYAGRVNRPEVAEDIIKAGYADMVAVGRGHLADAAFVAKAKGERGGLANLRPCIGTNDCINRIVTEGLPLACAANPALAAGDRKPLAKAAENKSMLVIGGGPAGMQLAMTAAQRGHRVQLWEKEERLGGQLLLGSQLPGNALFRELIRYQSKQLDDLGVDVQCGREASRDDIIAAEADEVVFATGATPRRPSIPGMESAPDMSSVLRGGTTLGDNVAVVVQDDNLYPLAFGDLLARRGHNVTLFIQTHAPAPHVSRYSAGTYLGRLSEAGVKLVLMEAVTAFENGQVKTRNIYSQRTSVHEGFDDAVFCCGGLSQDSLFREVEEMRENVHVVGDAYAPRRLIFATKTAYGLGRTL